VFDKLFFSSSLSDTAATLASFATFGAGFFARPFGAALFGHFGDRVGRRNMLIISLTMMGLASAAIGLLPTYASIGLLAPILLVTLRLIQGFGVGGEWGGAVLMVTEHAPDGKRGRYGACVQVGVPAGLLLASVTFLLVDSLTTEAQFMSWGWRIPFLLSIVLVALGLFIRLKVVESPDFAIGLNLGHDAMYGVQAAFFAESFSVTSRYTGRRHGLPPGRGVRRRHRAARRDGAARHEAPADPEREARFTREPQREAARTAR
jgi:MFS family permease